MVSGANIHSEGDYSKQNQQFGSAILFAPLHPSVSRCVALNNTEIKVQGCVSWKPADGRPKTGANRLKNERQHSRLQIFAWERLRA